MGRRGGWRSIPPELMVPTVIVGLIGPVVAWFHYPPGGVHIQHLAVTAQSVLVLFGLLELRRRLTGAAARWITVAAVVASVPVLEVLMIECVPLLGIDLDAWFSIAPTIHTWDAVAISIVLSSAARTWRSPLGALLVIAAVLNNPPELLLRAMFDAFDAFGASRPLPILAPSALGHAVLVLATYARLGAASVPAPDIPRAERAARRAAQWQRLRVAAVVLAGVSFAFRLLFWERAYSLAIGSWLVTMLTAVGTASGLLGLARSDIPGLSARGLCIAAFATAVSVYTAELDVFWLHQLWDTSRETDAWHVGSVLATQTGVAVGVAAVGSYLRTLDDRPLARAVERWLACIVILGLATVVATAVGPRGSAQQMVGAAVFVLSSQTVSLLILAHVHARLARRLALVSAIDAF